MPSRGLLDAQAPSDVCGLREVCDYAASSLVELGLNASGRSVESYELPYLDPLRLLPESMTSHLRKHTVQALSPHVCYFA